MRKTSQTPLRAEKSALTITLNQGSGFEHSHF